VNPPINALGESLEGERLSAYASGLQWATDGAGTDVGFTICAVVLTALPTQAPTRAPTRTPSYSPSNIPTQTPVSGPTAPTSPPTSQPSTMSPTAAPTSALPDPFFLVNPGSDCTANANGSCVWNNNWPNQYDLNERCSITVKNMFHDPHLSHHCCTFRM